MTSPGLFVDGEFKSHSGAVLPFKIDCDALSAADIETLAEEISRRFRFGSVFGVPRGGERLAEALRDHISFDDPTTLIVDDVLTTGASMEDARERFGSPTIGVVIFARGPCPNWVTPLFATPEARARQPRHRSSGELLAQHRTPIAAALQSERTAAASQAIEKYQQKLDADTVDKAHEHLIARLSQFGGIQPQEVIRAIHRFRRAAASQARRETLREAEGLVKPSKAFDILMARELEARGQDAGKKAAADAFVRASLVGVLTNEFEHVKKAIRALANPQESA
jgi:hypothetical protein